MPDLLEQPSRFAARFTILALVTAMAGLVSPGAALAQTGFNAASFESNESADQIQLVGAFEDRAACRPVCRQACRRCRPGTLMQWSYGNSFSGGPDLSAPLVTDRPDFTEASSTVGLGVAQIEFGYTYVYDNEGGDTLTGHSFGEPLLRYGILADWLELRLAVFPIQERTVENGVRDRHAGTADMYFGFKIALTPQESLLPEMALIPQMNLPTGSRAFTSENVEPGLNWIYSWEINDFLSTAGSTQANRRIDETGQSYVEVAQSWVFGYTLTERLGAYTEWFGLFPSGADVALPEHFFNGGFTYLINNDVQFDIRAGVGLNDAAADYFLGTGLSIRFQ